MKQMNLSFIWKCSSIQIPAQSYENFLPPGTSWKLFIAKMWYKTPLLEKLLCRFSLELLCFFWRYLLNYRIKNYKYCTMPGWRDILLLLYLPLVNCWLSIMVTSWVLIECWCSAGSPMLTVECRVWHRSRSQSRLQASHHTRAHFEPADTRQNCSHFWYCCCVTQLENKKDKNCFFCLNAEGRWNEIIRVHWRSLKFSAPEPEY